MEDYDNPKPKPREPKKKFISRCIPIVRREHPDWPMDKVQAVCYDIWRRHHKNTMESQGYTLFTDEAQFLKSQQVPITEGDEDNTPTNEKRLIAIIGNRFMNGGFFSAEELKKCYKEWENTLHDINHMGTSTGFFLAQTDITYFIGYHKNVKFDETNKSVSMELHVSDRTNFAEAWKAYVELCEMAGRIPNVSVTYYGKQKFVPVSELPEEANWQAEGYGKDDLVPVLYNVRPVCVSTVLQGRCNDKDGCGLRNTDSESGSENYVTSDSCDSCDAELDEEIEKIRQKLINCLKEDDKKSSED